MGPRSRGEVTLREIRNAVAHLATAYELVSGTRPHLRTRRDDASGLWKVERATPERWTEVLSAHSAADLHEHVWVARNALLDVL